MISKMLLDITSHSPPGQGNLGSSFGWHQGISHESSSPDLRKADKGRQLLAPPASRHLQLPLSRMLVMLAFRRAQKNSAAPLFPFPGRAAAGRGWWGGCIWKVLNIGQTPQLHLERGDSFHCGIKSVLSWAFPLRCWDKQNSGPWNRCYSTTWPYS